MPEVSFEPCPPEEFAGRHEELKKINGILKGVKQKGQAVLISGGWGSGKSSLLERVRYEIEEKWGCPAVLNEFLETPGVVFATYKDLLNEVRGHQKFGWFKKTLSNKKVKEALGTSIEMFGKAAAFIHPGAAMAAPTFSRLAQVIRAPNELTYPKLLTTLLSAIKTVGSEVSKKDKFLALLLDNINYSSDADFSLLKDIVRTLPGGIVLFIAFRVEPKKMDIYAGLKEVLDRHGHQEINLRGLAEDEIIELAKLRYNLSLPRDAASYLAQKISAPFFLINCFNTLQSRNLAPTLENIKKIMPEAVKPVRSIYAQLNGEARDRANRLCILRPPMPLSLIACMLDIKERDLTNLQDELEESPMFRRLAKGRYDFAHPALREFRRREIPKPTSKKLHIEALRCIVSQSEKLPPLEGSLAIVEHLFYAESYKEALGLNLMLADWLCDHFSYSNALELTQRALECSRKIRDRNGEGASLHKIGLIYLLTFKFPQALKALKESRGIAKEVGNRQGESVCLHRIGVVYEDTNKFPEALKAYNESLKIKREIGDRPGEAHTLHQIAMVYEDTNKFSEALRAYKESLEIDREIGHRAGEAMTLHQIGMVYQHTNKFPEALKAYEESLQIEREIGDRSGEAKTLHQIGMLYEDTNRFPEALNAYNESLKIEREIGDRSGEAHTLGQMGMIYLRTYEFDKALSLYKQCLAACKELGNRSSEAKALHQIAMVYEDTNKFSEALRAYKESLEIDREIGDRAGEAMSLHQIGTVYQETKNLAEALKSYEEALKIERKIGHRGGEAATLHQIGIVCQKNNKFRDALKKYKESLQIEREIGDRSGEAQTLHQIGMVYQDTNKFAEALEKYKESLDIEREIRNRVGEAKTLHQIGMLYEKTKKYAEALEKYEESLRICREIGHPLGEATNLRQIGVIYEQMKMFGKALRPLEQALTIFKDIGDSENEAKTALNIERLKRKKKKKD